MSLLLYHFSFDEDFGPGKHGGHKVVVLRLAFHKFLRCHQMGIDLASDALADAGEQACQLPRRISALTREETMSTRFVILCG